MKQVVRYNYFMGKESSTKEAFFSSIKRILEQLHSLCGLNTCIIDDSFRVIFSNSKANNVDVKKLLQSSTAIEVTGCCFQTFQLSNDIYLNTFGFNINENNSYTLVILPYGHKKLSKSSIKTTLEEYNFKAESIETINDNFTTISEKDIKSCLSLVQNVLELNPLTNTQNISLNGFEQLIQSFPEAFTICDKRGNILIWNDRCEELLGYSNKEVLNNSFYELLTHNKLTKSFEKEISELKKHANQTNANWQLFPLQTRTGDIKQFYIIPSDININNKEHLLLNIKPKYSLEQGQEELINVKLNLIAKKERLDLLNKELDNSRDILIGAINKIDTSKDVFYSLFSNLKEGFAIFELAYDKLKFPFDYFLIDANQGFEDFLKNKVSNLIGQSGHELFKTTHNLFMKKIRNVISSNKPVSFEIYIHQSNKNVLVSIYNYDKNKIAMLFKDISEKTKTQNILKDSQKSFNQVLDSIPEAIVITDQKGNIKNWNNSAKRLFGFTKSQIAYKNFQETLIQEKNKEYFQQIFDEYSNQGFCEIFNSSIDITLIKKHKTNFKGNLSFEPLTIGNSKLLMIFIKDISYIKEIDKLVKQGEERYKNLLNCLPIPYIELEYDSKRNDFIIKSANKAVQNATFEGSEIHSNLPINKSFPQYANSGLSGIFQTVLETQQSKRLDPLNFTHNSKTYWIEGYIVPASLNTLLFIFNDISNKKEKEDYLNLLEKSIDNSMLPTCILDFEGNYISVNKIIIETSGYTKEEFKSLTTFDTAKGMTKESLKHLTTQLKEKGSLSLIATIINKDGSTFEGEIHLSHIIFNNKDYMYCYTVNLTEKIKQKQSLKLLKFCIDHALVPSAIIDTDGNIVEISKHSLYSFNIKEETLHSKSIFDLIKHFNKDNWPIFLDKLRRERILSKEIQLETKENTYVTYLINASYINFENRELVFLQGIEVTEHFKNHEQLINYNQSIERMLENKTEELNMSLQKLDKANYELVIANKYKERFLSTISHELRTPLNGIIGFADLMKNGYAGTLNDQQNEYITLISNSSQNLLSLINDILDLVKIESDKARITVESFEINEVIDPVIRLIKPQFDLKRINLKCETESLTGNILADKRCCKHILFNFLSNSLKFTDKGGEVIIKSEIEEDFIKILVQDNGVGISDEYKEKIFKDFYQPSWVKTKAIGGTGIGLALSKKLAEVQNGIIGFESKEGKGSTFWFKIPV